MTEGQDRGYEWNQTVREQEEDSFSQKEYDKKKYRRQDAGEGPGE